MVFVDDAEDLRPHSERMLNELATKRQQLLRDGHLKTCKPVFVFSMKLLAYDVLDRSVSQEELEAEAVCRFG